MVGVVVGVEMVTFPSAMRANNTLPSPLGKSE